MKITIPVCIMCEAEDVRLWTLDNGADAAVTYVCAEHAAPLQAIVDASQGLPLDMQVPLVRRKTAGKQQKPKVLTAEERRHYRPMQPLLDWTPPEPPAPPVEVEESPEEVTAANTDFGVDIPVKLAEDAAEVGAGSDGKDVLTFSHGDVDGLGLQPLQVDQTPKSVKGKQRRGKQRSAGADQVVVHDVEVA